MPPDAATHDPERTPDPAFPAEYTRLEKRVLATMQDGASRDNEDQFNRLALEIFDFQFRHNRPYAKYCRALHGDSACRPRSWREIPALPTDAFRSAAPPACVPLELAARVFETSGTTSATPGRHHLWSTALYRESILRGWHAAGLPEHPVAVLTPSPGDAPHSSLSFMMQTLADAAGAATTGSPFLITPAGTIDLDRFVECVDRGAPILLLGTALSFLHLFEMLSEHRAGGRLPLPHGSAAMETGGYKGSRRHLDKDELYGLFSEHLGLAAADIINEYGMTELASQYYTRGLGAPHRGPHWTRVRVIDAESGAEAAPGEIGHLVITDLANLGSCISIATRDLARAETPSSPTPEFTLIGRDPTAVPRGCSRTADEMLS